MDLRLRVKVVKVVQEPLWTSEFDLEDELARGICCQGAATIFFSDGSSVTLAWSALGVDKVRFEGSEGETTLSLFSSDDHTGRAMCGLWYLLHREAETDEAVGFRIFSISADSIVKVQCSDLRPQSRSSKDRQRGFQGV